MDTELAAITLTDTAPTRQYKLVQVCATDQGVNVLELNSSIEHSTASAGYAPMVFSIRTHQRVCGRDRKSTRLNSSHVAISYAVFCLKKKKSRDEFVCDLMFDIHILCSN